MPMLLPSFLPHNTQLHTNTGRSTQVNTDMLFGKVHDICIQACVMEETKSQNQSLQSSINKCFVFTQLIRRQEFMG